MVADDTGDRKRLVSPLGSKVVFPEVAPLKKHDQTALIAHVATVERGVVNSALQIPCRPGHREIGAFVFEMMGQDRKSMQIGLSDHFLYRSIFAANNEGLDALGFAPLKLQHQIQPALFRRQPKRQGTGLARGKRVGEQGKGGAAAVEGIQITEKKNRRTVLFFQFGKERTHFELDVVPFFDFKKAFRPRSPGVFKKGS